MLMVMREDGDGKICEHNIMTKYVGNNCLGNTLRRSFQEGGVCRAGVLVVCQFCFGGRWCLGGTLVVCP